MGYKNSYRSSEGDEPEKWPDYSLFRHRISERVVPDGWDDEWYFGEYDSEVPGG